jgi:hypothetical protein
MEANMVAPTMIKEHMEVLGSDGVHVGTVDQLEGRDQVKLTKDDPDAGGEHHFIPLAWVDHVPRRERAGRPTDADCRFGIIQPREPFSGARG